MSEEQPFRTIQKMITAGMYDEARVALMSLDHPLASQWLKKLNQISPPTVQIAPHKNRATPQPKAQEAEASPAGTLLVVMAVMIGIGVLLAGGVLMLIQRDAPEPSLITDQTGCGGQNWVNMIDGSFNELYRYNLWGMLYYDGEAGPLTIDENLRQQEIDRLELRLSQIENTKAPECTEAARQKLIEAYKAQIRATQILQPDDPLQAFGLLGKTLRLMQEAATDLIALGAQFRRIDSEAIEKILDTDCPAFAYVTRTMYVDNQFLVMLLVDPQVQSLDAYYSLIRDLAQQYYRVLDDPDVVPCLWEVRNQFVAMIDSSKSALEALSGADTYGFEVHLERFMTAQEQFYIELEKIGLNPKQFGYSVVVRGDGDKAG